MTLPHPAVWIGIVAGVLGIVALVFTIRHLRKKNADPSSIVPLHHIRRPGDDAGRDLDPELPSYRHHRSGQLIQEPQPDAQYAAPPPFEPSRLVFSEPTNSLGQDNIAINNSLTQQWQKFLSDLKILISTALLEGYPVAPEQHIKYTQLQADLSMLIAGSPLQDSHQHTAAFNVIHERALGVQLLLARIDTFELTPSTENAGRETALQELQQALELMELPDSGDSPLNDTSANNARHEERNPTIDSLPPPYPSAPSGSS